MQISASFLLKWQAGNSKLYLSLASQSWSFLLKQFIITQLFVGRRLHHCNLRMEIERKHDRLEIRLVLRAYFYRRTGFIYQPASRCRNAGRVRKESEHNGERATHCWRIKGHAEDLSEDKRVDWEESEAALKMRLRTVQTSKANSVLCTFNSIEL